MNNDSRGGRRTLDGGGSDSNIMDVCQVGFTRTCDEYQMIEKIGEGTYGVVFRAQDTSLAPAAGHDEGVVALKRMRLDAHDEGVPVTTLREVALLKDLNHENVVRLREVVPQPPEVQGAGADH